MWPAVNAAHLVRLTAVHTVDIEAQDVLEAWPQGVQQGLPVPVTSHHHCVKCTLTDKNNTPGCKTLRNAITVDAQTAIRMEVASS